MRELVKKRIIENYKFRHLDEITTYGHCQTREQIIRLMERAELVYGKKLTIEEYVEDLTDEQLLGVLDSQACQEYR